MQSVLAQMIMLLLGDHLSKAVRVRAESPHPFLDEKGQPANS